jgi:hypothetical protein
VRRRSTGLKEARLQRGRRAARSTLGAIILIGAGLISGQAAGANSGIVTLKPGETKTVDIDATGRNTRACNDFFSSGRIIVTIGDNSAHNLSPGECAEDFGGRMIIQSRASGVSTVKFLTNNRRRNS